MSSRWQTATAVLSLLASQPAQAAWVTPSSLYERVEGERADVKLALHALEGIGLIEHTGVGGNVAYRITDTGTQVHKQLQPRR